MDPMWPFHIPGRIRITLRQPGKHTGGIIGNTGSGNAAPWNIHIPGGNSIPAGNNNGNNSPPKVSGNGNGGENRLTLNNFHDVSYLSLLVCDIFAHSRIAEYFLNEFRHL